MKRYGNLYDKIISIENLQLADKKARRGKLRSYGVIHHDANRNQNILNLHEQLKNKTFITSEYDTFTIFEPKERTDFSITLLSRQDRAPCRNEYFRAHMGENVHNRYIRLCKA